MKRFFALALLLAATPLAAQSISGGGVAVNLTGPITSVGAATSLASQTGTGTTFVVSAGPTLTGVTTVGSLVSGGSITGPATTTLNNTGSGSVRLVTNGSARVFISDTEIKMPNFGLGFNVGTDATSSASDVWLSRSAAGVLAVGAAGTTGSFTGAMKMATATFAAVADDTAAADATACLRSSDGLLLKGTGTLGICLGTSSARFKHDIAPLRAGLAEIMRLRPVSYKLNADHGDQNKVLYGFTAEDMRPVLPKLVGLDANGLPNSADYLGLVPVLVRAVQQQQVEIEALKRQIANDDLRLASAGAR